MEIVYFYKDYQVPMYQWQHIHIFDELNDHGCSIHIINPLEYGTKEEANEALIQYIKNKSVDLFMTPHNEEDLYIDTLEEIKKIGIPTLLICFDNLVVPFVHFKIAPHFDLVWLTSIETKQMFDKRGCKTIFLPYAANPSLTRANYSTKGVGFVGTPYGSRANMINAIVTNGIDVYCHCKNSDMLIPPGAEKPSNNRMRKTELIIKFLQFKEGRKILKGAFMNHFKQDAILRECDKLHYENAVSPSMLYQIYPKYSIALSSTSARNTGVLKKPLSIVNLRSFEIPMSGGVLMCQYTDEMNGYFEDGKEAIYYKSTDEMIDKMKYYINGKGERELGKIRNAAREKAIKNHTWYSRFQVVFDSLGIER